MIDLITSLDFLLLNLIQQIFSNKTLDTIMVFITRLGDSGLIWICIALVLLLRKDKRKFGVEILVALLLCFFIGNLFLKPMIGRVRPFDIVGLDNIKLLISAPLDYSFPSGHTMTSFAASTVIYRENKRYGIFFIILAILIAFSRMYLYVHFPSDVIAGLLLGICIGSLTFYLFNKKYINKYE